MRRQMYDSPASIPVLPVQIACSVHLCRLSYVVYKNSRHEPLANVSSMRELLRCVDAVGQSVVHS